MLTRREEGNQLPVRGASEASENIDFLTRLANFLDMFGYRGGEKETCTNYIRGFCDYNNLAFCNLLLWSNLTVSSRKFCKLADVPFCDKWLETFEEVNDKRNACLAYRMLLRFLETLLPKEVSDEDDGMLIKLRLNVLRALQSRLQDIDVESNVKGKKGNNGKGIKKKNNN